MRRLRVTGRVDNRVPRDQLRDRRPDRARPGNLAHLEQVRAVVLARRVVEDDAHAAVAIEIEGEEVGHGPVAARDRAEKALIADLAVVRRLIGELRLREVRRRRRSRS